MTIGLYDGDVSRAELLAELVDQLVLLVLAHHAADSDTDTVYVVSVGR